jgi:quercetin dioxygenase-like cupin family protein/ketosteroid isomerase-like protein
MKKLGIIIALFATAACSSAPPPAAQAPTTAQWDQNAANELKAASEASMKAWETGDVAAIGNGIADDAFLTSYDLDMMGQPISFASKADVVAYAQKSADAMKAMGATCKMTVTRNDCQATSTVGACVTEVDAVMTMGGKSENMSFRGTSVSRKGADGWKWTHWHGSLAKLPAMPPPPPPAMAPASMPAAAMSAISIKNKDFKWMTPPGAPPGIKMALVEGDPMKSAFAAYAQFPKNTKIPRHFHNANTWLHVIKGDFKVSMVDGKVVDLGAGDFGFVPAKQQHTTESKGGAVVFQYADAAWDEVLTDDQGKPLPPPPPPSAAPAAAPAAAAPAKAPAMAPMMKK